MSRPIYINNLLSSVIFNADNLQRLEHPRWTDEQIATLAKIDRELDELLLELEPEENEE
jgi:hypothetical protein